MQHFQRVIALIAVVAITFSPSVNAENRSRSRTSDLEKLAAELEQKFGRGSVSIERASTPAASSSAADAIVAAMNRERTARGLRPLRLNERLSLAANDRIGDMFAKNYFAHVSPDGVQPFVWAQQRGFEEVGIAIADGAPQRGYRGPTVVAMYGASTAARW